MKKITLLTAKVVKENGLIEILKRNIKISYKSDFIHEEYHSIPSIDDKCFENAAKELESLLQQGNADEKTTERRIK